MKPYQTVAYHTLGCKLNFSETSTISRFFEDGGYAKVDFDDSADIYLINTCSVTENADKRCKSLVKKCLKNNQDAFIAVIGCYAQLKPDEIAAIPGVDVVLGAGEKFNIVKHIEELEAKKQEDTKIAEGKIKDVNDFIPGFSAGDRTRSFLKIQDGCDYFCTFCTIPLARGKSRSNTVAETIIIAQEAANTEAKEIVLTGVNIGDFGVGTNESFYDLVISLDTLKNIDRIRISSIEPNLLTDEIIEFTLTKSKKFVPHFHIPLQSGSDTLLKSMRRKYDQALYTSRIEKIKSIDPDCCIGVDVIVGYPGETDEEFMLTYNYLKDLPVSYLHVFTYSERANTGALKKEGVVPNKVRAERSKMLRILSNKKKRAFYQSQADKTKSLLIESNPQDGFLHGFTENYLKVKVPFNEEMTNSIQEIQLGKLDLDCVYSLA
jgi:threonylcarbamoyladenosine tRNA methylthiotransferase MtaB